MQRRGSGSNSSSGCVQQCERSGVLSVENPGGGMVVGLETPCFLLHTVRGCSPHMTWDGLDRLHSTVGKETALGIQSDVLQLYDIVHFICIVVSTVTTCVSLSSVYMDV